MKRIIALAVILVLMLPTLSYGDTGDSYRNTYIEGYIMEWADGSIRIEEYDGTLHLLSVDDNTTFEIDDRPASYNDFKAGMEASVWYKGELINHIVSYSTQNPGYIPEGGKVRYGTVKKIDRDQLVIVLPTGAEETYFTTLITTAIKKNSIVPLDVLYEGDHVKLYFNEADTQLISRLEIEGDSIAVKDIYKGCINIVDTYNDILTLGEVEVFKNGNWEKVSGCMSIPFTGEAPVFVSGQKIPSGSVRYYRGQTAYVAVKEYFGSSRIERMIIKSQYESIYNDKIEQINWYGEKMELANKVNLTFNEGTMVIKSGRLVDRYAINPKSDAFIAAEGGYLTQSADLIYIYNEDLNNSNIGQRIIYSARLNDVLQGKVVTKEVFYLDKNEWKSYNDLKEFYYDNDTIIYDSKNNKTITYEEFYNGEYSVDENSSSYKLYGKRDWYAYFYNDGNRITHIMLQDKLDSLLKQRVTNGVFDSIENDSQVGWSFYLKNASDWSNQKSKWMSRSTSVRINAQTAMIIKNGRIISPTEILKGDRLYIVRDDFKAKIVIVK